MEEEEEEESKEEEEDIPVPPPWVPPQTPPPMAAEEDDFPPPPAYIPKATATPVEEVEEDDFPPPPPPQKKAKVMGKGGTPQGSAARPAAHTFGKHKQQAFEGWPAFGVMCRKPAAPRPGGGGTARSRSRSRDKTSASPPSKDQPLAQSSREMGGTRTRLLRLLARPPAGLTQLPAQPKTPLRSEAQRPGIESKQAGNKGPSQPCSSGTQQADQEDEPPPFYFKRQSQPYSHSCASSRGQETRASAPGAAAGSGGAGSAEGSPPKASDTSGSGAQGNAAGASDSTDCPKASDSTAQGSSSSSGTAGASDSTGQGRAPGARRSNAQGASSSSGGPTPPPPSPPTPPGGEPAWARAVLSRLGLSAEAATFLVQMEEMSECLEYDGWRRCADLNVQCWGALRGYVLGIHATRLTCVCGKTFDWQSAFIGHFVWSTKGVHQRDAIPREVFDAWKKQWYSTGGGLSSHLHEAQTVSPLIAG